MLSGNAVYSNTTVEFTCTASNVETLGWDVNDRAIDSWHILSFNRPVGEDGPIKAYLDLNKTITNGTLMFITAISTLVSTIDQGLHNGDQIRCKGTTKVNVEDIQVLNYSIVNGK